MKLQFPLNYKVIADFTDRNWTIKIWVHVAVLLSLKSFHAF